MVELMHTVAKEMNGKNILYPNDAVRRAFHLHEMEVALCLAANKEAALLGETSLYLEKPEDSYRYERHCAEKIVLGIVKRVFRFCKEKPLFNQYKDEGTL
jgi:hypothetical protein